MLLNGAAAEPVILTIGLAPGADLSGLAFEEGRIVARPFAALSAALLAEFAPVLVLTPLFARGCDAALVAQRLGELGYGGRLRVLCPALPDAPMIAREIRALAPGLTVEMLCPP